MKKHQLATALVVLAVLFATRPARGEVKVANNYLATGSQTYNALNLQLSTSAFEQGVLAAWVKDATPRVFTSTADVKNAIQRVGNAKGKLDQYQAVNIIDHGATGTGHQAAVTKFLESLVRLEYKGYISITYCRNKTWWYARTLGKRQDMNTPAGSWAMYHGDWDGTFQGLTCHLHPCGPVVLTMMDKPPIMDSPLDRQRVVGATNAAVGAATSEMLKKFWIEFGWPGAPGLTQTQLTPLRLKVPASNHQFRTGDGEQTKMQEAFQKAIYAKEVGPYTIQESEIGSVETNNFQNKNVLTVFPAMDGPKTYNPNWFDTTWLPSLQTQLGANSDARTIILQPFLWTKHPMQVRDKHQVIEADLFNAITKQGGFPSYLMDNPTPPVDKALAAWIDQSYQNQPLQRDHDKIFTILDRAKKKEIHLVAVYYTQASARITYTDLLKYLVDVFTVVPQDSKPVVIALLGDEKETLDAHTKAYGAVSNAHPNKVFLAPIGLAAGQAGVGVIPATPSNNIYLTHLGRTPNPMVMQLFQSRAELFITEGANTWQEILTRGTPGVSTNPAGDTKPWEIQFTKSQTERTFRDLIRDASLEITAHQQQTNNILSLVNSIRRPGVPDYLLSWKMALADPKSDQVVAALVALP